VTLDTLPWSVRVRPRMAAQMRRGRLVLIVLVAVLWPATAAQAFRDGFGLHLTAARKLDSRLVALTLRTAALTVPANVRILLPAGYGSHRSRRYPALYLLHGTSGGAADWTVAGDAERTTAGRPLIVVMPDIALGRDGGGWCTNWWRSTPAGRPRWETFHIEQLIPWVDENLRTIPTRGARAIAGLSQGGFCSMSYAARHPDLFGAALSYSGAPDIAWDALARGLVTPVINATEVGLDHVAANSMFGPRTTAEINWAAHDPTTLAGNLRHTRLFLYTGDGAAGPLDPAGTGASVIEAGVHELTRLFHQRLSSLGIRSLYDDYGPGTHSWPYWARDLRQSIGPIVKAFEHPAGVPPRFDFTAGEGSYSVYGWHVVLHRAAEQLSTLAGAGAGGFALHGSGSATVTTPPDYRAGASYVVTVRSRRISMTVGASGSLTIDVPLGPHVSTSRVTIRLR
jgi:S-formylglutathione hydrolase FrmB